jgi:hypothetical protein
LSLILREEHTYIGALALNVIRGVKLKRIDEWGM